MASMATPDSGDSNLPKESSNEICDIINCVAIYYEKGASGNAFLRKEKFRAQVSRKVRSLKALRETVRNKRGPRNVPWGTPEVPVTLVQEDFVPETWKH